MVTREVWCESRKLMGMLEGRESLEVIGGLSEVQIKRVWKNLCDMDLVNRQKDVAWMAVHRCLLTREFQRRRGLIVRCIRREGCRRVENVEHLFWECGFAKRVWKNLMKMVKGLTGMGRVILEMMMFELCKLGKNEEMFLLMLVI